MQHPILSTLQLADRQREAAFLDGCDLAVLAGAGCGKTTTLVARYLHLLVSGLSPEEIVAITFTERAGQEMRARVRDRVRAYLATNPPDQTLWLEHYTSLDSAPIGTIHSFCARLLRAHPAEASLDPDLAVLEENQAAGLRAEAVERTLAAASQGAAGAGCFAVLGGPDALRRVMADLLARRLDVEAALAASGPDVRATWQRARQEWLVGTLHAPEWSACLATLEACEPLDPADKLESFRQRALAAMYDARRLSRAGEWDEALACLGKGLQKPGNAGSERVWGGRLHEVRAALRDLCDLYHEQVEWAAKKVDLALDEELASAWPDLVAQFRMAVREYDDLKAQQRAVDFDDLEIGALRLLRDCPEVAGYWRGRCKAVLVDEFQDTNERQRLLIEALLGAPAGRTQRLFVVGDAKQSIYRFRGADVTVFRDVESRIAGAGGRVIDIDRTYRAHACLLGTLNRLLEAVLGSADDPACPYRVPFVRLEANRLEPRPLIRAPYVELLLGVGDTADLGRRGAATALAARLLQLRAEEGVMWSEVACLFRAATYFGIYEEAFEQAGIPHVTVAGTGFYERPEIRDLLNALRALATPTDDLALAGLLRSPAIGLPDADLYHLRVGPDGPVKLWLALQGDLGALAPESRERARRAAAIIAELSPQVGRQPIAAVLKRFLDLTGYLAILRLCPQTERAGRNVDKLLADAHRSQAVWVSDFLQYVATLSDTAARESEAPPEAGEAVQLMTVHRAKGLEFGVVVIADAAHSDGPRIPDVLLHPEWGLLVRVTRSDGAERREALAHGLARRKEGDMQDAEERRLLYVAATRAKEKLLVSGHAKPGKGGLDLQGWLRRLVEAAGGEELARAPLPGPGGRVDLSLLRGQVACALYRLAEEDGVEKRERPAPVAWPLVPPLVAGAAPLGPLARLAAHCPGAPAGHAGIEEGEPETPERVWRVVPRRPRQQGPAWLVGELVHLGLRLWRFDEGLEPFLRAAARGGGLTDERQIDATVKAAKRLLARFHEHELFRQLDRACERHHEVPYILGSELRPGGRVDLLSRQPDGRWWLVDFKTDDLRDEGALQQAIEKYARQLRRYAEAVRHLLGDTPRASLCFLNYRSGIVVHEVEP